MSYPIDEQNLERQRLLARVLEPITKRLLDGLGLRPDSRCLDIGCGIGETTQLIARFLGPQSECSGVDQDAALIQVAQTAPSAGGRLTFRACDSTKLPFEDETFDFVFTRYLLVHVQEAPILLREMLRVAHAPSVADNLAAGNWDRATTGKTPRCVALFRGLGPASKTAEPAQLSNRGTDSR